jgi:hypothetical protein
LTLSRSSQLAEERCLPAYPGISGNRGCDDACPSASVDPMATQRDVLARCESALVSLSVLTVEC